MRKYCLLSCKRTLALLPRVLLGLACVALALWLLLGNMLSQNDSTARLSVGIVGTTDDPILEMGMTALQNLDSSRYTVEILALTEEEAVPALQMGKVAAYAVIPEGFAHEAGYGNFLPITLVTGSGSGGMVELFKTELTQVITDILAEARKGVFGLADALEDNGMGSYEPMNRLALEYVECLLIRDRTYTVTELGVGMELGLEDYMLCALATLFLGLSCLPFGTVLIRRDMALSRLLAAGGVGAGKQTLGEFSAFFLCIALLSLLLWALLMSTGISLLALLAVAFGLSAVSYLLYQLATELIGGTVLQFLLFAAMAFVSGCMYPVYFLPETLQKLTLWLPTGAARLCLSGSFNAEAAYGGILLWGIGSLALSALVRRLRLTGGRA